MAAKRDIIKKLEVEGHECSNCGTRWQSPDYSSCPRCGYTPTELNTPTLDTITDEEFELEQGEAVMAQYEAENTPKSDEEKARTAALHKRMSGGDKLNSDEE
jgi:predicted  nucleic acid-binding Zn-ribbon protein